MSLKVWRHFWHDPAFSFEGSNSCTHTKDRSDTWEQQLCSDKRLELAPFSQAYNMVWNPRWAKGPSRSPATEQAKTPHLPASPAPTSCCIKVQVTRRFHSPHRHGLCCDIKQTVMRSLNSIPCAAKLCLPSRHIPLMWQVGNMTAVMFGAKTIQQVTELPFPLRAGAIWWL